MSIGRRKRAKESGFRWKLVKGLVRRENEFQFKLESQIDKRIDKNEVEEGTG